jgi:hypothetical protein
LRKSLSSDDTDAMVAVCVVEVKKRSMRKTRIDDVRMYCCFSTVMRPLACRLVRTLPPRGLRAQQGEEGQFVVVGMFVVVAGNQRLGGCRITGSRGA